MAADIEAITRAVPGVAGLFRTGSAVSRIVDAGAQALGLGEDAAPLVHVEQSPHGTGVQIAIGVHGAFEAVDVVQHVHAAIESRLSRLDATPAEIRITIVHIDDTDTKRTTGDDRPPPGLR